MIRKGRGIVAGAGLAGAAIAVLAAIGGPAQGDDDPAGALARQIERDGAGVRAASNTGPALAPAAKGASLTRSLAQGGAGRSGAFWLATGAGRLVAESTGPDLGSAQIARGGQYAVSGASGADRALGVRPTKVGFTSYARLKGGARSASWRVDLPGRQRVLSIHDGGLAVLAPRTEAAPRASASTSAPRNRAAGRGTGAFSAKQGGAYAASLPDGWRLVTLISAPASTDTAGRTVRSKLTHAGDLVTVRTRGSRAAVTARVNWAPTGDLGNGYWSHGADRPLRSETWSMQRGRRTRRGCGYVDRGRLGSGKAEEEREVATAERGCGMLVETGTPFGSRVGAAGAHASSTTAVASRRRKVHRNKAYNKSIQEDPVQIDVNSVKDSVDWRSNRHCVRPLRRRDATDAYGPTGWSLTERHRNRSRSCKETTMMTYAKFKGGQYFPPCTGFKVTTIYADNIMQGYPKGKGGYFVYHVTGGPPCYKALHWDRKRRNRRVY